MVQTAFKKALAALVIAGLLNSPWVNCPWAGIGSAHAHDREAFHEEAPDAWSAHEPRRYSTRNGRNGAAPMGGVVSVKSMSAGANVVLGGTVIPEREVTLAAQMPGRVQYIAGTEGDWFETDELLVAIDDDDLLAQRNQVLTEISRMRLALGNAQVQYSREWWAPQSRDIGAMPGMGLPSLFDQFFTRNIGSGMGYGNPWLERHTDLYSQGTRVGQAQARYLGVYSRLQEIDARLRDTRSIAPFPGVIVKKFVEAGDTVQPGQPLLRYADTEFLQIQVDVPARQMPGLQIGMSVPAILDVGDTRVDARVAQIYPMADAHRHTVTVKFDLPRGVPGGPGMYAEVMVPDISVPLRQVPVIPLSAVVWRGSLPAVFVQTPDGRTELRLIRLGEAVDRSNHTVLSGLREGEHVLANPAPGMSSDWSKDRTGHGAVHER